MILFIPLSIIIFLFSNLHSLISFKQLDFSFLGFVLKKFILFNSIASIAEGRRKLLAFFLNEERGEF